MDHKGKGDGAQGSSPWRFSEGGPDVQLRVGTDKEETSSFSERRESRVTLGTPMVQSQENRPSRSPFPNDPQAPGRGPWSFTRMKSLDRPTGTQ